MSDPEDDLPPELGQAGAVIDKTIEYMLEQEIDPVAIASALLGGALGLLARTMEDDAILRVLDNAAQSVRAGELDALRVEDDDDEEIEDPEED
jgi:hypothetical protein